MLAKQQTGQKTILVIDDDPDLAMGLAVRLRSHGYDVSAAPDAITGFARVRNDSPDLVLLDLGLPGGDGLGVLERIRTNMHSQLIPVIVLTARDLSFQAQARELGAQAYLQKPVDNELLIETVAEYI